MKILMLNHNVAWSGGTFLRAFHFSKHLVERGHAVTLMSTSPSQRWRLEREFRDGVEMVYSPDLFWGMGRSGWDPWDTLRRMGFLWSPRWDIVHAWDTRPAVILPALFARWRSRSIGCELAIDWCDWWGRGGTQTERPGGLWRHLYNPIETLFEERFRNYADGTTVISSSLRKRAEELGVPPSMIRLLPQGCEPAREREGRFDARRKLAIEERRSVLITIGPLNMSDAVLLFRAMHVLRKSSPNLQLFMIGNHRSKVPEDLRADGVVVETGYVPDDILRTYVSAADALVVPLADTIASRARWPSKVSSCLASGPVVVMTRVGDLAVLLEAEGAAIVCDNNADALAEGVLEVMNMPPERRAQIEQRGRTLAERRLSWPLLTQELETFYQSLRDSANPAGQPNAC